MKNGKILQNLSHWMTTIITIKHNKSFNVFFLFSPLLPIYLFWIRFRKLFCLLGGWTSFFWGGAGVKHQKNLSASLEGKKKGENHFHSKYDFLICVQGSVLASFPRNSPTLYHGNIKIITLSKTIIGILPSDGPLGKRRNQKKK